MYREQLPHVPPGTSRQCPQCTDPIGADCFHMGALWHFDCWLDFVTEYNHHLDDPQHADVQQKVAKTARK